MGSWSEIDHNHRRRTWHSCYSRLTWPALLANHLDLDYVCYAIAGSSNQTIVRQFFQYLPHITEDDFVIINWTYIDRWDFFTDNNKVADQWITMRPSGKSDNEFKKVYFKYMHYEVWNKLETLKAIMLLIGALERKKIKFMMTSIDPLVIDQQFQAPSYIENLQEEVKNYITWFNDMDFVSWAQDHKFSFSETGGHPLEEAHVEAFNYIRENYGFAE